ncbi:MAG: hypothetical protein V4723_07500 [Pseudomonadota bacterium]
MYEQLQESLAYAHPAFPVRASDNLKAELRLDDEDLDMDLAAQVEQRTGISLDCSETNPHYGKINTVKDVVMFFQAQMKRPNHAV